MVASFAAVVLSSPDPVAHAAFYRDLLGWESVVEGPEWVRVRDPERERPGLSFQLEQGHVRPDWPDGPVQLQSHLDVLVDDLDAEVARARDLGATLEAFQPQDGVRVMRDPSGQMFCLFLEGS
ncbi:VOC family protein [Jatrophihabitans fulvus]